MSNSVETIGPGGSIQPDEVIDVAIVEFSRHGFDNTKLETIARISGMSKRMIHYHFSDKKGLYLRALNKSLTRLQPSPADMEPETSVPVDGMRKIVKSVFRSIAAHQTELWLILLENTHHHIDPADLSISEDNPAVPLQLDRLLILGQDSGVFRPGISTQDIYMLIASLACYRLAFHDTTERFYEIDMMSEANTAGLERMAVDTTLAFLTSTMSSQGGMSYLALDSTPEIESGSDSVYGIGEEDLSDPIT
ncbi:TetR/AcrR family transcriptional regulator [Corynebacterium alimapuense]|uniref:TetR/AcrR family transcriptional regulator n=1 Tax=Corynebacterium alimapuense TaxID=1576874 RepID=A0A3M8K8T5_9CORY|nr:TetR/AcrR family transcriptional regulator [Corynebacterium alimapuense]RNE49643.1 TetR/AcrR family transcriptional regulator [Corynebacterium alimapuense]